MSELKVYVKPLKTNMFGKTIVGQSYYLKSEADKVIAHNKYKRCLAMADALTWEHDYLVDFVSDDFPNVRFKRIHRIKWVNRWLALAEEPTWAKFLQLIHKEAK